MNITPIFTALCANFGTACGTFSIALIRLPVIVDFWVISLTYISSHFVSTMFERKSKVFLVFSDMSLVR